MKISRITACGFVAAVALVLAVAPAGTVAGLRPHIIALLQLPVGQLMAAQANSPFEIDSTQTLQSSTDQRMLTASSAKRRQTQGEISQGHVSPTRPKEFPPPGRDLTHDEHERILKGIYDLNVKTGERYKK
jgi:hypothetical protein